MLIGSIATNIFYYAHFREANDRAARVNTIIASNVERNVRQSVRHIQELVETESQESMRNLEQSMTSLVLSFNHWVDLNQSERRPNERMNRGLNSIEMLKNTISHHLNNQYRKNGEQLTKYDVEMLENVSQQLNRLLLTHHNIEDRVQDLKDPFTSDAGLVQIAENLDEITRLYRHSQKPNSHPDYIVYEEAVLMAEKFFRDELQHLSIRDEAFTLNMRDGVHYYELNYYNEDENLYTIWVDAIDGNIRNFEMKKDIVENAEIGEAKAIDIARNFVKQFYKGELKEEIFYLEQNGSAAGVYSFRFTPIRDKVEIVSDALTVNLAANSGEILKFTNDFIHTKVVYHKKANTIEEIEEKYSEEFGEMHYDGEAIVRSFFTRYKPRLTYAYRTMQNQQEVKVFIDVTTGVPVYQLYYIYQPIVD